MITRTLYWDRGRPARFEHRQYEDLGKVLDFRRFGSRCALTAGGTPAVPVKSSSGEAQATTEGVAE